MYVCTWVDKGVSFHCNTWKGIIKPNTQSEHKLNFLIESDNKDSPDQGELNLKASMIPNMNLINSYDNFTLREKVFEYCTSGKMILFAKFAMVNKTDDKLYYGIKDKFELGINPHSNSLFDMGDKKELHFRSNGYGIVYH